ncbi:permease [Gardnerella vaginalis]|uniref:permease n=1 Tax=Gardnerella vaginalis TaxID=2702 RepID=UPI000E210D8B|nr:permease [Gardnerella vaginalis]RDW96222.1 permease [Gardnerella vaginalis]RDW97889.1 permease [Gardnerella vaginalis]
MCFKNRNLQNDSKVKTCKECIDDCKECIDKKTLDSISSCIGFFYLFLIAIPVLLFIFYKIDTSNSHNIVYLLFILLFSLAAYITIICFYSFVEKVECEEIRNDLKPNTSYMFILTTLVGLFGIISICIKPDNYIKINALVVINALVILLVTCCIGVKVKSYNNKYALTKIDIDCINTLNKYSNTNGCEEECKLLVIKMSYLKYYKVMETNYLMMSALCTFITSVLGISSISLL